ncbi:flagellar hook-associated protein FlgK [Campylobacter hyointestinalis subsp. hyointestinalis]|uniref:Flagellar hook-associated protein 1 n=1 Tax=Campylobacter hyointestinalis subsp. hyointestinalis TaxID=91352 RepID=A0A9W5AS11_CAMHY|nr:flagellar hook-associated protein FlgK [Campylobacter hyointestinalis]CUU80219.1 flagellar hook-associated protein FlgK [Campylobacter hyointestinalis subsp. hyointestinalis]CUU82456.1 flagellar hook-associated protein FlgK [Campylobacter hyointestinalis subsp. hyointestinalis]CUU89408.1 flagellar hook-associated protein FlgK [Campylobacter hyointestinalis subsp. hyointestinalis]
MGIFDSLYTGVSGLGAAQIQIQVTGQNITNVNSDYYTRQRVVQSAREPFHSTPGDIGLGVKVDTIIRIHDEFTFDRLKTATSNLENTTYKQQVLQEIAQRFPDLQDTGLIKDMENYFGAWNDFASHPYESSQKTNLLNLTQTLTSRINDTANQLEKVHVTVNDQVKTTVDEINRLGEQIAKLNAQIQTVESNGINHANDLRDKRDQLELTMSKLVNISTFKNELYSDSTVSGTLTDQGKNYNLNISGITLVDGVTFHPLKLESNKNEYGFSDIFYELNDETRANMSSKITGGKLGAILDLRGRYSDENGNMTDGMITEFRDNLDTFAKTLIQQTNNIYASSAKDKMNTSDISGMRDNTTLQNIDKNIKNGSFDVIIYNASGGVVAKKTININQTTSMNDTTQGNSIVSDFNADTDDNGDKNLNNDVNDYFVANFKYDEITKTGNLSFTPKYASGDYKIAIQDNGTNFAGVFGLSKFFEGDDAASIRIESSLAKDSSKIQGNKAPINGDNSMANAMVNLQNLKLDFTSKNGVTKTETISGYYRYLTTDIAAKTESVNSINSTNTSLYKSVYSEFQSISGVNIDEELSNLIKFQSSYGAAAKIITTVEKMLETLIGLKQ